MEVEYNFAISSNRILPETCPPDSRRSQASSPVVVYFVDRILRSNNGPSREWVGGNGHFETRLDVGPQYLVHENSTGIIGCSESGTDTKRFALQERFLAC